MSLTEICAKCVVLFCVWLLITPHSSSSVFSADVAASSGAQSPKSNPHNATLHAASQKPSPSWS